MNAQGEILLAIDTTISSGSISLWRGKNEIGSKAGVGASLRAEDILVNAKLLLEDEDISKSDIDLVAVTLGPGSYTGIRVGIATAQGLSASLGIKCVGYSSLSVLTQEFANNDSILTGIGVGREEIICQGFEINGNSFQPLDKPQILSIKSFIDLASKTVGISVVVDKRGAEAISKSEYGIETVNCQVASDNVARLVGRLATRCEIVEENRNLLPIYAREFALG